MSKLQDLWNNVYGLDWSQPVQHKPLIIKTYAKEGRGNECLKDWWVTADLDYPTKGCTFLHLEA